MFGICLKKSLKSLCRRRCKKSKICNDEKTHPTVQANLLSRLFFCWTFPILFTGYHTGFTNTDLHAPLPSHRSTPLADKLEKAWLTEFKKPNPKFWKTLVKVFGIEFFAIGVFLFILEFFVKLSQPVLICRIISTHIDNGSQEKEAYIYAALLVLNSSTYAIMLNWYMFHVRSLAMKIKVACASLVYRKALKIKKDSTSVVTTGSIVNLIANDLQRFDKLFLHLHYIWSAPLQTIVIFYLLYVMLGVSATVGIGIFYVFIPIQIIMGKHYSTLRWKTLKTTDQRVSLISEILSSIQVIKMYTWEDFFIDSTNTIRTSEVKFIRGTAYLKAIQDAINKVLTKGAVFFCIILYVLTGNNLYPQYVFVMKSFYNVLKLSMGVHFSEAIKTISEVSVSFKRMEKFLLSEEVELDQTNTATVLGITLEGVSTRWCDSTCNTLKNVNFNANPNELVTITGPVGSGKTTLIKVILQELTVNEGMVRVGGTISYSSQEPVLLAGSIKSNILFGQKYDQKRYQEILEVCSLNQDFERLEFGDSSIVGNRGISLSGGQQARICLARTVYKRADLYILDDPFSALDASVGQALFKKCILTFLQDKCVVLVTHQVQHLGQSSRVYVLQNGEITVQNIQKKLCNFPNFKQSDLMEDVPICKKTKEQDFMESKSVGKIPFQVYCDYLFSGGSIYFLLIIFMFLVVQTSHSGIDYFESFWVKLEQNRNMTQPSGFFSANNCIYIYTGLIIFILMFSTLTTLSYYTYFTGTSIRLHNAMFTAVIKAKLDFFHQNPIGTILNRFSKDTESTDVKVPKILIDTIQNGLSVLSIFILVAIVNPWMLINSILLLTLFYAIRSIYVATSRELKRIEAISRSPIYSHLTESLNGLETIRVFQTQQFQRDKFDEFVNGNTSAFYIFIALSTSFGMWLSLCCSVYVAFVITSCFVGTKIYGANLGLIITQATSLSDLLQWGMIQWSEFENEMTSVERISQFKSTDPEEEIEGAPWPNRNYLEFRNVTLQYKQNFSALDNLSFCINSGETIGVVGRTGAGKTTLISAIFRMVPFTGKIQYGGVNSSNMALKTLRSNISIIPQHPVLFTGSVRFNLDPYGEFSDFELWSILNQLNLSEFVANQNGGLNCIIREKGSNLSLGQKQLLCLARALLRKNRILVLDEATANIDFETDSMIQNTIKNKLKGCTVMIIAHRLHTVIDCDKILVMDAGRVVEFGHPYILLEHPNGALYNLAKNSGMVNELLMTAQQNYHQKIHVL